MYRLCTSFAYKSIERTVQYCTSVYNTVQYNSQSVLYWTVSYSTVRTAFLPHHITNSVHRCCSKKINLFINKKSILNFCNIFRVNAGGAYTGENDTFALAGYIRSKGESHMALMELVHEADANAATSEAE